MSQAVSFRRQDEKPQRQNKETQSTDSDGIPDSWVRAEETGVTPPTTEADVFDIRMNNRQAIHDIWKSTAGRSYRKHEGQTYLVPMKSVHPKVTMEGAIKIIETLQFLSNPAVVLGKTSYEEAVTMANHNLEALTDVIATDKKNFKMNFSERQNLMAKIEAYVWSQLSRAVDGFEAKNLITQISEERGEHKVKQNLSSGKSSFWGRSKE